MSKWTNWGWGGGGGGEKEDNTPIFYLLSGPVDFVPRQVNSYCLLVKGQLRKFHISTHLSDNKSYNPLSWGRMTCSKPSQLVSKNCFYAYLMYSSLFSSVTLMSPPPSLRSCCSILPSTSKSAWKYSSRPHSSMLLSL